MCNFNKDDVIKIARAILDSPVLYLDSDRNPHYYCSYCDAELITYGHTIKDFKHDLNCPVLVAMDILTGT